MHHILSQSLTLYCASRPARKSIKTYTFYRLQYTKLDEAGFSLRIIECDAAQGTTQGLPSFTLYINDIEDV